MSNDLGTPSGRGTASRELDAEVAVRFFGYHWKGSPRGHRSLINPEGLKVAERRRGEAFHVFGRDGGWMPNFSTDIAAAWKVVEATNAKAGFPTPLWQAPLRDILGMNACDAATHICRLALSQYPPVTSEGSR